MSTIGDRDIVRLAKLSRLSLSDDEIKLATKSVGDILRMMDKLRQAEVSDIPALSHIHNRFLSLRADVAVAPMPRAAVLQNAPSAGDGYFLTPTVIE